MRRNSGRGYREIGQYYESLIRTGRLAPGEMLPTEMALAKKHQVTRTTIRRAFAGLVNKGLVSRQQGRGSFVADAADVESRDRSHVVIASPHTTADAPPGGFYTEDIRYHDGIYEYLESLAIALGAYGRPFRICFYTDSEEQLELLCKTARKNQDLGIIIYDVDRLSFIDRLLSCGVPVVFVDCMSNGRAMDLVKVDGLDASRRATRHLLQTTPSPVAFVGGETSRTEGAPHKERLDGFRLAHSEAGRPVKEEYIALGSVEPSSGRQAVDTMCQCPEPPTGYFCADDDLAAGVIERLRERGISVPAQVSVFGFGDSLYSRSIPPNLSTVALDRGTMGRKAVDLLQERLNNPTAPPKIVSVPARILLRQTTIVAAPADLPESPAT